MPVIDLSPYKPAPGTPGDANQIASGFQLIQTILNGIDNANFAAGKIFDPTKLMQNGAVQGQALLWDTVSSTWKPGPASPGFYRKATPTAVNTTVTATDLLNGEITIAAGVMGATGKLRLTANGDWLQNASAAVVMPRFQLVFGGTTLIDTGANTRAAGQSATRSMWRLIAEITNTATGAQNIAFLLELASITGGAATVVTTFTTGTGIFYGGTATNNAMDAYAKGYNTSALDTTTAKTLVLNVINGANNALYETKLFDALVEVI